MNSILIRTIEPCDNKPLANIIRSALKEFDANKPGTVYFDKTTDDLYNFFKRDRSRYFVAFLGDEVIGGSGIYPTNNLPKDTCELVKLYLNKNGRGKGIGKILMNKCIESAKELGYKKMYLETMPELTIAIPMYEKLGFTYLPAALGCSGHTGCTIWMIKDIN